MGRTAEGMLPAVHLSTSPPGKRDTNAPKRLRAADEPAYSREEAVKYAEERPVRLDKTSLLELDVFWSQLV